MDRLREPSTWASLSSLFGVPAAMIGGTIGLALGAVSAACGAIGVYLRERAFR